jgi:hypothetical protein
MDAGSVREGEDGGGGRERGRRKESRVCGRRQTDTQRHTTQRGVAHM